MTSCARLGVFALAFTTACDLSPLVCEGEVIPADVDPPPMTMSRVVAQVMPTASKAVDILFVIDDSLSMADEQEQLGIWSNELFDVLATDGELPDLHIAVVSSTMPAPNVEHCTGGGVFHVGTAVLKSGTFITDVAGPDGRVRNYDGTLEATFARLARVGDSGCGFEQPFKATRTVLSKWNTATAGFLRDDALLLVVFVTDEDDCSSLSDALYSPEGYADANGCTALGPPTSYRCFEHGVKCHDGKGSRSLGDRHNCRPDDGSTLIESVSLFSSFLQGLKQQPGQVIVAGIYGKPNGIAAIPDERITSYTTPRLASVCAPSMKEGDGATPAVRMNALLASFGARATQSSICEPELAWAMRDTGLLARSVATRSPCLRGALIDSDVQTEGIQPRCHVELSATSRDPQVELPSCDGVGEGVPCYSIVTDANQCGDTDTMLAVQVAPLTKQTVTVRCDAPADAFEDRNDDLLPSE